MVSIIIPVYNAAKYIRECIDSVLIQGLDDDEIILIDDHSFDNSWTILEEYQKQNRHRVRIFKNEGKGACAARNYGYSKSSGKFIQFLDSDDSLSKDKMKKQLEVLNNEKKLAVANCAWIHFEETPEIEKYKRQLVDKTYNNPIEWLIDSWNGGGMGQTGCWLIPRELIEMAGGWDVSLLKNQDGEFMARVLANATKINFVDDVFAYYRKPKEGNVSQLKGEAVFTSVLKSYKSYEYIMKKQDTKKVRLALAKNYNNFIYAYYNKFPQLAQLTMGYIHDLGEKIEIPFSNKYGKLMCKILGLRKTMILRKILKGY